MCTAPSSSRLPWQSLSQPAISNDTCAGCAVSTKNAIEYFWPKRRGTSEGCSRSCPAARGYRWVGLYDVRPSHIAAIAWTGPTAPRHPTFPRTQGLNGAAVAVGAPVIVQDVRNDPRYLTTFGSTRAEAIFPVCGAAGELVGTIDVESDRINAFTPEDEAFLRQCADVLAFLWS